MSEMNKTFQETIFNALATLLAQNKFDTDTQLDIYNSIKKAALDLQEIQISELRRKIEDWEKMYEGADTSLYTLGLRHAIDIITGETATDINGFDGQKYEKGSIQEDEL